MKDRSPSPFPLVLASPGRRRFVQGLAAGGMLLGLAPRLRAGESPRAAPVLTGDRFELVISETPVDFTGTPRMATTINGSLPGPTLRWREGETVTIRVTNRLREATSIHWHGMLVPFGMDGVPGISFPGIAPGETFVYRFRVRQSGTYWYHSHSGFQEQTGMYGAIVIDPAEGKGRRVEREHVVMLSDWTDEDPMRVFAKLKKQGDYYNFHRPTAAEFLRDARRDGVSAALAQRRMWNEMRMSPADLADVSGYTYTYLMNGTAPAANWTALFRPGERVRLRFVNASAMTFFDVRIPGLKMTVVQADGQDVDPVSVDEIRIAVAETYDVLVEPHDQPYTIFAQSMDRTGFARGTLAPREGMSAAVPEVDPPQRLTMADMMGSMEGMGTMDHGAMSHAPAASTGAMTMDHSAHGVDMGAMAMDHSMHGMGEASPPAPKPFRVRHARTEYGAGTDMRVDSPRTNLDDPGIGLRGNGRRVLTYADLHTAGGPLEARGAEREIELHLTGNMERYTWSFDGVEFPRSKPVRFRDGERLRVVFVNDTMMTHPMHMHGMWSELEGADGRFQARKHTISVQPAQRITFLVSADAAGRWAWHCHLLYHMEAGMFREILVS